jgi:uncharacterized protein (TIGR02996 family)
MSDQNALLQAILDNPADDVPRLAYADWCDEHDQVDRAEFIRVQIELSKLTREDDSWDGLVRRERELWDRHGEAWRQPLPKWARKKLSFRRGFPSAMSCTIRQWLTQSSTIRRLAPVDTLEIICPNESDSLQMAHLADSPLLAGVSALAAWWPEQTDIAHLASSPHISGLRVLSLSRNIRVYGTSRDKVAEILAGSSNLAGLTALGLGCNEIGDGGVEALVASPHLARLTALDLNYNLIRDAGVRTLANSTNLANLTHLDLCETSCHTEGVEALAASTKLTNLVYLNLHGYWVGEKLGPGAAKALAASTTLSKLRTLGLALQSIGPDGMRALARSPHLANLQVLHLLQNQIGDDGLRALAESPYLRKLRVLDLSDNGISDASLRALAASPNSAHLQRLAVDNNACSESALEKLKAAQRRVGAREVEIGELRQLDGYVHEEMNSRFVTLNADIHR